MSSRDKDPQKKRDTSSESSKSSDSEIDEDLKLLKIKKNAAKEKKDVSDESKPPNREGISTSKLDLLNEPTPIMDEPVAGPSGLQKYRQETLNEPVAGPSGLKKEKRVKAKAIEEDIRAKMEEGEKSSSSSSSLSLEGSSSRRDDNATDSGNTSADVSEIRSEMADSSREGSAFRDGQEDFMKECPNNASALERHPSSGTSDTNISEIQDFVLPPESRSVSISTDTGEEGNLAYIERIRREGAARGSPISTSSGIGLTDQSELGHQQDWILAGEGVNRPGVIVPNRDLADNVAEGGEPLSTSESMESEPNVYRQMQNFERLFRRQNVGDVAEGGEPLPTSESMEEPNLAGQMQDLLEQAQPTVENEEEINVPEDERGDSASRSQVEKAAQASGKGEGSPYKRKRSPNYSSDSVISEIEAIENPKQKHKLKAGKKRKTESSQSRPVLQSSSESTEPNSSSSQELYRKESPDIKSSSGSQEISETRSEGMLPGQQHAVSSMEHVALEEEKRTSPLKEQYPRSMETQDPTPETTLGKGDEGAAEVTETSEAKPSTESTDQAYGPETYGTLKVHEEVFEDLGSERSVEKPKRERKQSNSPPSDEKPGSSCSKAATSGAKRARSEKKPGKRHSARHDSRGNVPKNVGLGDLKQGESKISSDESDYTPSDDEKDTQS